MLQYSNLTVPRDDINSSAETHTEIINTNVSETINNNFIQRRLIVSTAINIHHHSLIALCMRFIAELTPNLLFLGLPTLDTSSI